MIERIPKHIWPQLDFSEFGGVPQDGEIYAYIEKGEVKGWYLVERQQVHVGPFFVAPEHRGNGIASALAQHAHETLGSGYYVAAMTPQTEEMCRWHGMTEIDGKLFLME